MLSSIGLARNLHWPLGWEACRTSSRSLTIASPRSPLQKWLALSGLLQKVRGVPRRTCLWMGVPRQRSATHVGSQMELCYAVAHHARATQSCAQSLVEKCAML